METPAVLKTLALLKATYVYVGVFFAACTGQRDGEVVGIMWKDVDYVLRIRQALQNEQKLERKRKRMALGEAYHDGGFICTWEDGRPISPNTFASRFRKLALKARVPVSFHKMTHTAASLILKAGVPLKNVSEILGHASVSITGDVYGHVSPAGQREAISKLGEVLFGG